jgi:hypothetical protein
MEAEGAEYDLDKRLVTFLLRASSTRIEINGKQHLLTKDNGKGPFEGLYGAQVGERMGFERFVRIQ